jgi:hypothetical protein
MPRVLCAITFEPLCERPREDTAPYNAAVPTMMSVETIGTCSRVL